MPEKENEKKNNDHFDEDYEVNHARHRKKTLAVVEELFEKGDMSEECYRKFFEST